MTTIAYKNGTLAGDSRIVSGDLIDQGEVQKVFKLGNGVLIGFAGTLSTIQEAIRELKKDPNTLTITKSGRKSKHRDDWCEAIVVYPDGLVKILEENGWVEKKAKHYAIGSGSLPAEVAMRCGKTARQAVKIAMEFDGQTGGKVHTVQLDDTGGKQ